MKPKDKICIVTGGTSGIGLETIILLLEDGFNVYATGSSERSCSKAQNAISNCFGSDHVSFIPADLSSQLEVKKLAKTICSKVTHIDILINNAGVVCESYKESAEGIEYTFAVNYLSHFILTQLLLPKLVVSGKARIINVASQLYARNLDLCMLKNISLKYDPIKCYEQSKLAKILFTISLSEKLATSQITVNCLHPGVVSTEFLELFEKIQRKNRTVGIKQPVLRKLLKKSKQMVKLAFGNKTYTSDTSVIDAAKKLKYMATDIDLNDVTGGYFENNILKVINDISDIDSHASQLWDYSIESTVIPLDSKKESGFR